MSITQRQVAVVLGKAFTESQLLKTSTILAGQPFVPIYLFQNDQGQNLVGAGTALFLSVRNCPSEQADQDLRIYWLKQLRLTDYKQKVWEDMLLTLLETRQRFAAELYNKIVCGVFNYRERTKFAIDVLTEAMPIAAAKQQSAIEHLP